MPLGWWNSLPSRRALEMVGLELNAPPPLHPILLRLDQELTPIRLLAERLASKGSSIDSAIGAVLISHRPHIGTEAFASVIFPGVAEEHLACYESLQSPQHDNHFAIPTIYRNVIRRMNGGQLFGLNLYGLPTSMFQSPPLVNRTLRQPLDLGTANLHWRKKYSTDPALFHFGSGPYSPKENVGYFLNSNGGVLALLKEGHQECAWPSIEKFLIQELSRAEETFGG